MDEEGWCYFLENTWLMDKDILGRTILPLADDERKTPIILQYNGAPPSGDHLREIQGLHQDTNKDSQSFMYLVATSFLEVMRGKSSGHKDAEFAPPLQMKGVRNRKTNQLEIRPQLLFDNALQHMMEPWLKNQGKSLPRVGPMERIYLLEAIDEVAWGDEALRLELRHDVHKWREVLGQLDAEGVDLQCSDLEKFSSRLALPDPRLVSLMKNLQEAFHRRFKMNEIPYEKAARWYISDGFRPAHTVIMEGFSFFRPLQVFFAERCFELGAKVVFIHSYRAEQEFGFQVLKDTYSLKQSSLFSKAKIENIDTLNFKNNPLSSDLDGLRHSLFANESPENWCAKGDGSVTVEAYPHRHTEVRACVNRIAELIKTKDNPEQVKYSPGDIRIVCSDPEVYRNLLLEEVEIFRHKRIAAKEDPILEHGILKVPPRQLLLTPLGRFILTLYNIWDTEQNRLCMTPEQFITILSSGLLSVPQQGLLAFQIQQSVKRFIACKDQFFTRCRTKEVWLEAFDLLPTLRGLPKLYRLPSSGLLQSDVENWKSVLLLVDKLCVRLFNTPGRNIAEHIRDLREGLNMFETYGMTKTERELLQKIQEVFQELEAKQTAPIATVQFKEILNEMVSEREEIEDAWGNQVAVIAPEGLDNSIQPIVFFLGADSSRLPRPFRQPWPFYDLDLKSSLEQDRYLFLAAIRATRGKEGKPAKFYLSYAQTDENKELQPSPYFQEVTDLLGLTEVRVFPDLQCPVPAVRGTLQPIATSLRLSHDRDYEQDPYTLSELFHYKLCPYRYQLDRLDPQGYCYTTNFQLRFLAKGVWINLIFDKWREEGVAVNGLKKVQEHIELLYKRTEPMMKKIFFGFYQDDWQEVRRSVEEDCLFWADRLKWGFQFELMPQRFIPLPDAPGGQRVLVDVALIRKAANRNNPKDSLFTADVRTLHWIAYGRKPTKREENNIAPSQYELVVQWNEEVKKIGRFLLQREDQPGEDREELDRDIEAIQEDLTQLIKGINQGNFPKNPGDHCKYCPNNKTCLGVELNIHLKES